MSHAANNAGNKSQGPDAASASARRSNQRLSRAKLQCMYKLDLTSGSLTATHGYTLAQLGQNVRSRICSFPIYVVSSRTHHLALMNCTHAARILLDGTLAGHLGCFGVLASCTDRSLEIAQGSECKVKHHDEDSLI
eukprot:scaffold62937_cov21-Prasinocladus_malaysianus.AAC.1